MEHYEIYKQILNEELVPAMGCTEPISIAYCASKVKEILSHLPTKIDVFVSGNILKNVKSVVVPNTNGLHGIEAAVAIGMVAGNSKDELEVIAHANKEQIKALPEFLRNTDITISSVEEVPTLYIEIIGYYENDYVRAIIKDSHTHIYKIEKNNEIIVLNEKIAKVNESTMDKSLLSVKDIIKFANEVKIEDVKDVLDRQIKYNMAIANEGLKNNYGANVGKTILKYGGDDIVSYCKALAAAASDARMNGCEMPVVINSGSGNQGLTCSIPVIAYAQKKNIDQETLYRALVVSNLCTTHIKNKIGKLSAFCGVVIAGVGCGAGIAYLNGGREKEINHTIVNSLAIISGVVCDGAKSSCAAKISTSVEAGFLGYFMYKEGNQFLGVDGIVKKGVENTIKAIGKLATIGMCETDKEIIQIMIEKNERVKTR